MNNFFPTDFLLNWAQSTEKIIGSELKKKGVKISDTTKQNIKFQVLSSIGSYHEIRISFRDSLRMTDMGAGRGYKKGQRINILQEKFKKRVRKRVTNRPLYRRISNLQRIVITRVVENVSSSFLNSQN